MSMLLDGTQGIDFNDGSNQSTAATPYARKNLIINGDMKIAQRGTSVSSITSGSDYRTIDRWKFNLTSAGTWTMSQDTDVPTGQGFANSLKLDCTTANGSLSANSYANILYFIEAQDLQHLKFGTSSAKSITLSFWVKSNKTGTIIARLNQNDASRSLSYAVNIATADTWQKVTWTINGDTSGQIDNNNESGLNLQIWIVAGTDFTSGTLQTSWGANSTTDVAVGIDNYADNTANYINITGVQLEVGDAASDFEFVPYDMELARCQRYYQKYTSMLLSGYAGAGNTYTNTYIFPVELRTSPTVVYSNFTNNNSGNASTNVVTTKVWRVQATMTVLGGGFSVFNAEISGVEL